MSGLFSVHCDVCIFEIVLVSLPQLKSHLLLYCRPAFICVCAADINVFVEVEPRRAKTNRLFLSPFFSSLPIRRPWRKYNTQKSVQPAHSCLLSWLEKLKNNGKCTG